MAAMSRIRSTQDQGESRLGVLMVIKRIHQLIFHPPRGVSDSLGE